MTTKGTYTLINNTGRQDEILLSSELLSKRLTQIKEQKINEILQPKFNELQLLITGLDNVQDKLDNIRLRNGYNRDNITYIKDIDVPNSSSSEIERRLYNKLLNSVDSDDFKYYVNQKKIIMEKISTLNNIISDERKRNLDVNGASLISISEIERTHIMFMHRTFKPFVATGFEYSAQDPTGGKFGLGDTLRYKMLNFGDYMHDQVLHLRLEGLSNVNPIDRVRYCDMVGHRIMESVRFSVNLNTLDEYNSERYNNYYNFELPEDRKVGWLRNVGQTVPQIGYLTSDVVNFDFSEVRWIADGPQTLKTRHDVLDLFIPLLFWFNRDIGLSLPNTVMPSGQTFIDIKLADVDKLCASDNRSGSVINKLVKPTLTVAKLYTNQIFVNPEIQDLMLKKVDFTLIRVHKQLTRILDKSNDSIFLSDLKLPVEYMYFNFKPLINETGPNNMDLWDQSTYATLDEKLTAGIVIVAPGPPPVYAPAASFIRHYNEKPCVTSISLHAYGIPLYKQYPAQLFNSYLPWKFGKVNTPEDLGYYFINFNINPGEYQPSGHFNVSRSREFYLDYVSPYITPTFQARFSVTAIVINFLLVKDGSAIVKFAT